MDFAETIRVLQANDIGVTGAHPNVEQVYKPLIRTVGSFKIGIVNVAEGEESKATDRQGGVAGFYEEKVIEQIKFVKKHADICLVIVHAGNMYPPVPPPYIHRLYRKFVEAGADSVIGHHPPVPQGVEVYQGKPIAYSLGSFAHWHNTSLHYMCLGYLLELTITRDEVKNFRLIPLKVKSTALELLKGNEKELFLKTLAQASEPLQNSDDVDVVWDAFADKWCEEKMNDKLARISELFKSDKIKGASVLRNAMDSPCHRDLFLTALQRIMYGTQGNSPQWAKELVEEWSKQKDMW